MTQFTQYIYLHGFASGPESAKARYLRDRFTTLNLNLQTPDLNQADFTNLTLTRQIQQIAASLPAELTSVTLIGSSFGGLTATWLGEQHLQIKQLILLAPAFQFLAHWLPKLGEATVNRWQHEQYLSVYHYGEQQPLPLSYNFVTDAAQYDESKLRRSIPTLIMHGRDDEVIPIQASRDYADDRPWVKLIEFESDHTLSNVMPEIWPAIQAFCSLSAQDSNSA